MPLPKIYSAKGPQSLINLPVLLEEFLEGQLAGLPKPDWPTLAFMQSVWCVGSLPDTQKDLKLKKEGCVLQGN